MAVRRQKLSQRRKAVGLTQESLAERLGVERSTVIRWEAGESQPLPSIRPNLARALHVSIDQLAELLTQSEHAGAAPSADLEAATPVPAPQDQRPGDPELDSRVNPQIAETVEALRRALRSAGVSAEDLAAMLLIGGSSRIDSGHHPLGHRNLRAPAASRRLAQAQAVGHGGPVRSRLPCGLVVGPVRDLSKRSQQPGRRRDLAVRDPGSRHPGARARHRPWPRRHRR